MDDNKIKFSIFGIFINLAKLALSKGLTLEDFIKELEKSQKVIK